MVAPVVGVVFSVAGAGVCFEGHGVGILVVVLAWGEGGVAFVASSG